MVTFSLSTHKTLSISSRQFGGWPSATGLAAWPMFHVKPCFPHGTHSEGTRRGRRPTGFANPLHGICQNSPRILQCHSMLDRFTVRELLAPFDVTLSDHNVDMLLDYLDLLLRWNRKINLTSIPTPEECVTRHFGESFFLSRVVPLQGRLLDIGTGAGFPGLALKLLAPDLEVVLLEPVAKKRAFLKWVARICGMDSVHVSGSRVQEFAKEEPAHSFDLITVRAVGGLESVVPAAIGLLKPARYLCLWVGSQQVSEICRVNPGLRWQEPVPIPLSSERQILVGRLGAA